MPNTIKHKRSSTVGLVPGTGSIDQAELAINIADGKLYTKNSGNTIINLGVTSISGTYITPNSGNFINVLSLNNNPVWHSGNFDTANIVKGTGTGASTSGYLPRWTSSSGLINSSIFQSGNNIGIGLTNPSYPLHITSGLVSGYLYFGDNTKNIIANGNNLEIGAGDSVYLKTAGNTALIADGDGYDVIIPVGLSVGTVNRTATLEVEGSFLLHDSGPYDIISANSTNGLRINYDGGGAGGPFFYTDRSNGRIGIKQEFPSGELHIVGTAIISDKLGINKSNPAVQLDVIGTGNFSALTINNSGVALYDITVANLGTISGSNSINCGQDRQIQNLTLNGVATTFTKGSGWPTSNSVARETTLNIFASGNTSVTWTIVNDWYRQPDSPLPSGRHIVLLRSIGSGTMQGHYIGSKTN